MGFLSRTEIPAVLALDVGGSNIQAAVVEGGRLMRDPIMVPTEGSDDHSLLLRVVEVARQALNGHEVKGVGVACAGPFLVRGEVVTPVNIPAWAGFGLRRELAEHMRLPVTVHNDAVAMMAGEAVYGSLSGVRNGLGMVVSTGIGAGLLVDGRVLDGERGNAGHLGHVPVPVGELPCPCGGDGCLETVASGTGLVASATAAGWEDLAMAGPAGIFAASRDGDDRAEQLVNRAAESLGHLIAATATALDLTRASLGGGIAVGQPDFVRQVEKETRKRLHLSSLAPVDVVPATLGANAGLIGAAALHRAGAGNELVIA